MLQDLFIYEMANNHQGSVDHGLKIIKEMGALTKKYGINAAVKLQYRQLDTFIHPVKRKDTSIKYVKRFLDTELTKSQFLQFITEMKNQGMKTVVTPFDEASVDVIVEHGVDIIKVASCSADDWPLLEKMASAGKPIIASTGGLSIEQIDNLVSFLRHRCEQFAVLHCVSIYPTPNDLLHLGFMQKLMKRYPDVTIGYSGHENPGDTDIAKIAISMGAKILERHVGVPTDEITLNGYSMNPTQVEDWIQAVLKTKESIGDGTKPVTEKESTTLLSLKRGVFAKEGVKKGEVLTKENTYYAFPCEENQLTSGQFEKLRAEYIASKNYAQDEAFYETCEEDQMHHLRRIIHDAKGLIDEAGIVLNEKASVELSHHYGLQDFEKNGCLIVNLVNREYCKKIIVVFPGQVHPEQYHVKKEETFHVLHGDLELILNGISYHMKKGDIKTIERGIRHKFTSEKGCIFEEVSTTHFRNDSFYLDPKIAHQDPMQRKTVLDSF